MVVVPQTSNVLLQVVSDGFVNVEREGISVRYPCKPLLIATFNPEEGELREHLLDRIAVALSADAAPLELNERVEAAGLVTGFADNAMTKSRIDDAVSSEDALRNRIIFARADLEDVQLKGDQLLYLCEEANRAGCQGQRAELFAVEVRVCACGCVNVRVIVSSTRDQCRVGTNSRSSRDMVYRRRSSTGWNRSHRLAARLESHLSHAATGARRRSRARLPR